MPKSKPSACRPRIAPVCTHQRQYQELLAELKHVLDQVEAFPHIRNPKSLVVRTLDPIGSVSATIHTILHRLSEHERFIRDIKSWVAQLPIEARVDMPELQPR